MDDNICLTWIVSIIGIAITVLVFLRDNIVDGITNFISKLKNIK